MHRNRRRATTPINQHQGWYPRAARRKHRPSTLYPSFPSLPFYGHCEVAKLSVARIFHANSLQFTKISHGVERDSFGAISQLDSPSILLFPLCFSYFSHSTCLSPSLSLYFSLLSLSLCRCIPIEFILLSRFYFTFFVLRSMIYINRTDTTI